MAHSRPRELKGGSLKIGTLKTPWLSFWFPWKSQATLLRPPFEKPPPSPALNGKVAHRTMFRGPEDQRWYQWVGFEGFLGPSLLTRSLFQTIGVPILGFPFEEDSARTSPEKGRNSQPLETSGGGKTLTWRKAHRLTWPKPSFPLKHSYLAMGQNSCTLVNIPIPTEIDQNGWCTYPKMAPLVLTHSHLGKT